MTAVRDLSVGIDVGGTNTDAVVLDPDHRVLAWTKQPTTADVTGGIRSSLTAVLADLGADRARVGRIMLGTTHATNAIVRRRDLARVAVIRLGAPAATEFPPLVGWPDDLLFISHNLAVVRYVSHRICVMQHGRIVEEGETEALLDDPRHPYTVALVGAVPVLGRKFDADTAAAASLRTSRATAPTTSGHSSRGSS